MEQYDFSPEMKKLFAEKQKQRAAAKEFYQNMVYNPYRPINDGTPFDPALFRFTAMSSYHLYHFKPTVKSHLRFLGFLSPIVILYFCVRYTREKREKLLRSGVVRYEDRNLKNLL